MFGLFGDKKKKLEKKYTQLLEESHRLSHSNRKASDLKMAEADQVLTQIKDLESSADNKSG